MFLKELFNRRKKTIKNLKYYDDLPTNALLSMSRNRNLICEYTTLKYTFDPPILITVKPGEGCRYIVDHTECSQIKLGDVVKKISKTSIKNKTSSEIDALLHNGMSVTLKRPVGVYISEQERATISLMPNNRKREDKSKASPPASPPAKESPPPSTSPHPTSIASFLYQCCTGFEYNAAELFTVYFVEGIGIVVSHGDGSQNSASEEFKIHAVLDESMCIEQWCETFGMAIENLFSSQFVVFWKYMKKPCNSVAKCRKLTEATFPVHVD